jgi:hypothetical protein
VLAGLAGRAVLLHYFSDGPTSVPSCSWTMRVSGQASQRQAGLVRCYLRALAQRDSQLLAAVAYPPARITSADLRLSGAARSGLATASFRPNPVDSADVTVTIRFANGARASVEMMLANPATWDSWRLAIGSPEAGNGPPAVTPGPARSPAASPGT